MDLFGGFKDIAAVIGTLFILSLAFRSIFGDYWEKQYRDQGDDPEEEKMRRKEKERGDWWRDKEEAFFKKFQRKRK